MSEMDEKKLAENGIEVTNEDQLELVTGGAKSTRPKPICTKCGYMKCTCNGK